MNYLVAIVPGGNACVVIFEPGMHLHAGVNKWSALHRDNGWICSAYITLRVCR
jgi:hypothetical protein